VGDRGHVDPGYIKHDKDVNDFKINCYQTRNTTQQNYNVVLAICNILYFISNLKSEPRWASFI